MGKVIYISLIAIIIINSCRNIDNPAPKGYKIPFESDSIKMEFASSAVPYSITDIYFFNKSKGIAVTSNGQIYKISNYGFTWTLIFINPVQNQPLNKVLFTNENTGYAVGGSNTCSEPFCTPPGGVILKTSDGGSNWISVLNLPGEEFVSISVNNSGELFVVSNNTNDFGSITKSSDAGNTWTTVATTGSILNGITFSNNLGLCTGDNGKILRSSDNGATWNQIGSLLAIYLTSMKFSGGIGFCLVNNISVFKSTDNGSSWTQSYFSDNSSFVLNPLTGNSVLVFGGGRFLTETGTVCGAFRQTLDSGINWREVDLVNIYPISITSFYSNTEGYVVAGSKLIRVTVK
jgi:photosystem II stability/assembly factor-like uncharacterized protein